MSNYERNHGEYGIWRDIKIGDVQSFPKFSYTLQSILFDENIIYMIEFILVR